MSRAGTVKSFFLALVSTLLLFLSGVTIPLVGVFLIPFVPQPALGFGLKYGKGRTAGLAFTAIVTLSFIGGKGLALGYSVLALMVILLLLARGRGWSIEALVVSTASGMLVATSAILLFLFGSFAHLRQALQDALKVNLFLSLKVYEKIGLSREGMELLREHAQKIMEILFQILPALTFAAFVAVILMNLFFLQRRFPDDRSLFSSIADVREWKCPESFVWFFILSGFALFLPVKGFKVAALNLFLASMVFYFFQGLAVVAYYFHRKKVPALWRGLTYALIAFEQVLMLLVVGLGLFDLWGDFRRLKKKDLDPTETS